MEYLVVYLLGALTAIVVGVLFPNRKDPHSTFPAECDVCTFRWQAVAPAGTYRLQCPNCDAMTGGPSEMEELA